MDGSDKDGKTGIFKDLKTRISEKSVQVQMASGKIYGPYSRDEVLSFIESKRIRGEEKVLFEGETEWRAIATDPEFFDAIHAVLSGNKIKRRKSAADEESSAPLDASDKTRASKPSSTHTELLLPKHASDRTRFTDLTGDPSTLPIWSPPVPEPALEDPLEGRSPAVKVPPASPAKKTKSKRPSPKLVVAIVATLLLAVLMLPRQGTNSGDGRSFQVQSARFYGRPLTLALKELRLPLSDALPPQLTKTSLVESFVYSLNARKIVERLNESFDKRSLPEAKNSAYWAQRAVDLQLLGFRTQVINLRVGASLIDQGNALWKALDERKLLDESDKKLLALVSAHALGDWDGVSKSGAQGSSLVASWLDADALWWNSWLLGVKKNVPAVGKKGSPAEMELVDRIRQAYLEDNAQMSTWLLQLAALEPESPYLWYVSAQINWRKSRNVQVQSAYRDFIIGLGSLSLYPPSIQIAYWAQFSDFLRSYARAETLRRATDNLALLRRGDIGSLGSDESTWWDLGDEGLNAKDIADEILTRSSKGMLNARDRAALEVLGSNIDEGARYRFVVGTHLAFEGQWGGALKLFDELSKADPKNTDALFGKIWALCKLFRFSEAQDTYEVLVKASLGTTTHLRSKAILHLVGREYLEAHRIFRDYLKQSPTDGWAHYFQAETFLAQENYLECIKSANLARLHSKGELQFRSEQIFYRCRVRGGVGIRDSLDSIAAQIKQNPDNLPLRILYIELMNESQLYEDAIRVLEDSLKYFPYSAKLKLSAGAIYDAQGVPGKAIENYAQAAKLDPTQAEAWVRIAKAMQKQDRFLDAAKNFELAARIQPAYPEIYLFAARAYENAGLIEEAALSYAKEIEERPAAVGTFVEAAEFLLKNNAPQKIPELYRRFQKGGFEEDPRALVRLALAYSVMGDLANAKAFASRAVAGNPDNPYSNLVLANILDRAGDYNLAKRYYESYLRLMPLAEDRDSLRERLSRPPYTN